MNPAPELLDQLFRERIERAQQMTSAERFVASLRHSEDVARIMMAGVRNEFPDAGEAEVLRILQARLDRVRGMRSR